MSRRPPPLILVSNRGPVTFGPGEGQWREQTRGGGGLVTALLGLAEHTPALWVSAAISDGDGVYVAFGAEGLGAYDPLPPLHEPDEAAPPSKPWSWTCGLEAHTVTSAPAFTVAARSIVIRIASLTALHGPAGSLVVKVSVTPPAVISFALGV